PGHMPVDHRVDDLDLAACVDLEWWRVPVHCAAELARRLDGSRMHRLPENVAGAFGNHPNDPLTASPAPQRYQDRGKQRQRQQRSRHGSLYLATIRTWHW